MKKKILSALLLLSSAGCQPEDWWDGCRSQLGMRLHRSEDCSGFLRAETKALNAILAATDLSFFQIASSLYDVRVTIVYPGERGRDHRFEVDGQLWHGYYFYDQGVMMLANDDWSTNSLTHEMLHAIEGKKNPGHVDWDKNGFNVAIDLSKK